MSNPKILQPAFFNRPVLKVAQDLIGKYLVIKTSEGTHKYQITETEGYEGEDDLASHARFGPKGRSGVMYEEAGTIYIYLIYGMYFMLNIVTGPKDHPSAVLIRGVEDISGPGRITKVLGITNRFNGHKALPATGLWFEDSGENLKGKIITTPRIGVAYAGPIWAQKPYRFVLNS